MPFIQNNRIGQPIGFNDHKSNKPISISQSIDITKECLFETNNNIKIIVDYANRNDKMIVGLHKMTEDDEDIVTYFFLTVIENISCFPDFYTWAKNIGLKMEDLKNIIVANAPVEPVTV